uniref:Glutathione synthetase n=1 Tax=Candidatus Aschnera chinzeii TaxID=1485666 RepID=A0AAT9G427_9ENTR|nr:MAG: glutathione synthase [Candidatus Aschnera chinzeii]
MIKLGIIMDPISQINIKKDSSFAMLLEAKIRGYKLYYMEINNIYLLHNEPYGYVIELISIIDDMNCWYKFGNEYKVPLKFFDIILMRKDPPFNMQYIYATYILELATKLGVLIVNNPKSLREFNEKLSIIRFPDIIPDTLVTSNQKQLYNFYLKYLDIILKPLNSMGGDSLYRLQKGDPNVHVIIENMTKYGTCFCMAQNYISDIIIKGDKRILVINGEPIHLCLARFPKNDETRANLAAGGYGKIQPLSSNDLIIVKTVSAFLKKNGLIFVGLDVIGNYLTEINITSPTCIREIEAEMSSKISITNILFDTIEKKL